VLGRVCLLQGRVATSAAHSVAADRMMRTLGYGGHRRMTLGHLAAARAIAGDLAGADEALASCLALPGLQRIYDPFVAEARAWVAAARGRLTEARSVLDEGADAAIAIEERGLATHLLHALARLGDPGRARARLTEIAAVAEGPFVTARADHVAALDDGDAEALAAAGEAFAGLGARLVAAEAFADASRVWRRANESRRATAAANRSRELAADCEGAVTPALSGLDTASPLTDREREVALLAARGQSNRAVAEALYVSERTVENHLQRIYTKLGVRGRTELAAALGLGS
jgi:DNA-binding CsgD family transcriptional regulator